MRIFGIDFSITIMNFTVGGSTYVDKEKGE